ncbi:hypothetical protein KUCAC02_013336, partial [Chaenocephalus aceratus]
ERVQPYLAGPSARCLLSLAPVLGGIINRANREIRLMNLEGPWTLILFNRAQHLQGSFPPRCVH